MLSLSEALQSPRSAYRPLMSFAWNTELDRQQLAAQIDWLAQAGYGGFLIMAWYGLPYPLMGEAWLDAVEFALHQARERDLEVWIWDDWIFPSGFGGGLVTADPAYWARRLHLYLDVLLEPGESVAVHVPVRCLAAGVLPVDKYANAAGEWTPLEIRPGAHLEVRADDRRQRLLLATWEYDSHAEHTVHQFSDNPEIHSVDMLNPQATRRFLQVVHERYANRLAPFFGATLKGFFYDEPREPFPYPWTDSLPAAFQERKGYDIRARLPLMLAYPWRSPAVRELAQDYFDVWTDLCADSFYGELERWCHSHGLLSIGHQDLDHKLQSLATISGHFFKNSARNDAPGIDVIWDQIVPGAFFDFPRFAGSAARAMGKSRAMSESLAAMGFGMSADAMRYVLEHQLIRGVNRFFPMIMTYDIDPLLYLHPPELSPRNPMIAAFGEDLNERIGRVTQLMQVGNSGLEVGLYLPMADINLAQSLLAQPYVANVALPWDVTHAIAEHLAYLPCEFDYLWDEALMDLELVDGGFRAPAGHCYRILILPPRVTLRAPLLDRLRQFREAGGTLLAVEEVDPAVAPWTTVCASIQDLDVHLPRPLRLEPRGARITLAQRVEESRTVFLLLNEDLSPWTGTLQLAGEGRLVEVELSSGSLALVTEGDDIELPMALDGTALRVFILDTAGELPARPAAKATGELLVLADWQVILPDGTAMHTRIDGRGPAWDELGWPEYSGWMTYRTEFDWPSSARAVLDLGLVQHGAEVALDGQTVGSAPFRPYQIQIPELALGQHNLEVRVLNTWANEICGTPERRRQLEEQGAFKDTYARDYLRFDARKLRSGLLGPVKLTPIG